MPDTQLLLYRVLMGDVGHISVLATPRWVWHLAREGLLVPCSGLAKSAEVVLEQDNSPLTVPEQCANDGFVRMNV